VTTCDIAVTQDGTSIRFALAGEIDLTNRDTVADELNRAIGNETTAVVLDTSAVTYLDSTALRFLFALAERLERLQVTFAIVAPPDSIGRKVMDLAGLGQVADVRDD
jgi:anti-anti-sigma factor